MTEGLEKIREFVGHIGDILTKAHLFHNEVMTEDHFLAQKIIRILMKFGHKIEATRENVEVTATNVRSPIKPTTHLDSGSSKPKGKSITAA